MSPVLTVLAYASLAAAAAALGAVPLAGRRFLPTAWIGWANALAAGMMIGMAYMLTEVGMAGPPLPAAAGAALGILFTYFTHAASGTAELDLNRPDEPAEGYQYKILLIHTLHSASEGVALGVAMVADLSFGIFVALAVAVHNVPEATVLAAVVRGAGASLPRAAGLAVATNVSQVVCAVATYAVVAAAPAALPWVLGFAVGALIDLVLVELLPESYREAGHTSIALVASVAMAVVVLLEVLVP